MVSVMFFSYCIRPGIVNVDKKQPFPLGRRLQNQSPSPAKTTAFRTIFAVAVGRLIGKNNYQSQNVSIF
jgi:hypothetical protein